MKIKKIASMKIPLRSCSIIISVILLIITGHANGQEHRWEEIDSTGYYTKVILKKAQCTLVFISKEPKFSAATTKKLINLFFTVYPEEVRYFNPNSAKVVTFVITDEYKGVAATLNNVVKFAPEWLTKNPEDIDAATHELMHVVQAYQGDNPGWLVEGIADYARYKFGINNARSGWELPKYRTGQSYTDAYRVTARFLIWSEQHYSKNLVRKLNDAMRAGKYSDSIWNKLTGKSLDELWYLYTVNPEVV
jgi:hypothetical protein